jgi:hypothetical protein
MIAAMDDKTLRHIQMAAMVLAEKGLVPYESAVVGLTAMVEAHAPDAPTPADVATMTDGSLKSFDNRDPAWQPSSAIGC